MIGHEALHTDISILPHEQGGGMYSHVLVPLDGSEASERALPHAQSLAAAFGARVHLLQVIALTHESEASRNVGWESPSVAEYSLDMARQLTATRHTRAKKEDFVTCFDHFDLLQSPIN